MNKSSFFQLSLLSKIKSFLSFSDFERVIHAFIATWLDYCNVLDVGASQASRLQLDQNVAACLSTAKRKPEHTSPLLA